MRGSLEHVGDSCASEGGGAAAVWRVDLLEGFEFKQEGVEGAEEVEGAGGVEVEDCGDGEAEEEVVCGSAGELARVEVGEASEVGFREVDGVEPVDSAFVTACQGQLWSSVWIDQVYTRFAEVVKG